jgi:serine/threonine-protein kinase
MSYQVLRQLAGGGFSEIFEVEDAASALPERLILKRLTAEMSARPDVQAAFSEEAKILRELKHSNIVTFRRCYFDEKRRICLLMEKVAGEPLDVWTRRHASRPELVLDLFTGVLAAVDYLHHRPSPFLHLDLKPDNLLVTSRPDGPEPMLIDFGIARRSGGRGLKAYTPPYGAPEQEAGGRLDCATDVYALGQILKELLAIVEGGLTEPARAAVGAVVEKATRPSRRERYVDAGEMKVAFRRACRARSATPAAAGSAFRFPRLPRWALLGAGAGFCLLLIVLAALTREETEPPASRQSVEESVEITPERSFDELQYKFEEALIQGHSDAESYYQQARELSDSLPEGSDAWRQAKGGLDMMSIHLSQAQAGGTASEEVRAILRQKHLTYQKP